jgi:hypothetical protein
MPHSYGPQFDLGPEGYHAQCANCGYEYGTHAASGERCPVWFTQPKNAGEDEELGYHETQKFALKTLPTSGSSE